MQVRTMLHHLTVMAMERECSLAFPNNSSKHLSYNWDICTYQKKKKKTIGIFAPAPIFFVAKFTALFLSFLFSIHYSSSFKRILVCPSTFSKHLNIPIMLVEI